MTVSHRFSIFCDRPLAKLFAVTFAMGLSMNSITAIWPLYIVSLGATVFEATYVISVSGILGVMLRVPSGMISDRFGRRKIVLTSIILASVSPILYAYSTRWHQLMLWATLYGSAFGLFWPTMIAWTADLVEPEDRTRAYSFLNMAFPIGIMLGPALGGIIVDRSGWRVLFILASAVHGLSFLPTLTIRDEEKKTVKLENPSGAFLPRGSRTTPLLLLILLQFIFGFGFGTVNPMIPIYLTERFQSTTTQIGIFSSIGFGAAVFLAQIPSTRLADKLGKESLLLYCCAATPPSFLLWASRTAYTELLVLYMFATAAWGLTWSSMTSILMESAPNSRRGLFSGLSESGVSMGFTAGPVLAGILWERFGYQAPLYASSLIFMAAIPTAILLKSSQQRLHTV